MVLKVFYDLMSQPCRALIMFLKLNNIPYDAKVIALRKGTGMLCITIFFLLCALLQKIV